MMTSVLLTDCKLLILLLNPVPKVIKKIHDSAEHETLNAHIIKYIISIKKINIFQAQMSLECCFSCS